jgi:hypothetical protein
VPGTTVEIRNQETNIARTVISDQFGNFEVTHLNAGTYPVTAVAERFRQYVATDITVRAFGVVRVDIRLELGDIDSAVEVRAVTPVIETDVPMISDVKSERLLRDLPLNIRNTAPLYDYVAMTPTRYQAGGSRFSLGGGRGSQKYMNVDGISSNSPAFGNAIALLQPSIDSVQEIRYDYVNNKAVFSAHRRRSIWVYSTAHLGSSQMVWRPPSPYRMSCSTPSTGRRKAAENRGTSSSPVCSKPLCGRAVTPPSPVA